MNYRRPYFPWIVAAALICETALFAEVARRSIDLSGKILWIVGSVHTATLAVLVITFKLTRGTDRQVSRVALSTATSHNPAHGAEKKAKK